MLDPTELYRTRDGVYAADLLTVALTSLDLFTWLSLQPADLDRICAELRLDPRPADVMCTLFTAMGLLARAGNLLRPTNLAVEFLVAGSRFDLRPYFASLSQRPACQELLSVLRTGEPAAWSSASGGADWEQSLDDPSFAKRLTEAMDARGSYLAPALARAVRDLQASRILDIAGGSGAYACALVDEIPESRATVLERHPVDMAARTLLDQKGYGDRVEVMTADMFQQPLPPGHDLHLFSHTLHDWDAASVKKLLAASFVALAPGGWLIDHDMHINADKTGPLPAAQYSVLLMHSTLGKCWSVSELSEMLEECGFVDIDMRDTAADRTALLAHKPERRVA